jgi:hypothetical protein
MSIALTLPRAFQHTSRPCSQDVSAELDASAEYASAELGKANIHPHSGVLQLQTVCRTFVAKPLLNGLVIAVMLTAAVERLVRSNLPTNFLVISKKQ